MNLPLRQMDARTGTNRRLRISRPQESRAFEDAEHFFVQVKMIGGAAGRNRADELCDLALDQLAVPAIAGFLDGLVVEANACRGGLQAARRAKARRYTDNSSIELHLHSLRQKNPGVLFEDIQHL